MSPKHWRAWGINHVPRKPVPEFDHYLRKEMFPNHQIPGRRDHWLPLPVPSSGSCGEQWGRPLCLLFSRLDEPIVFSHSLQDMPSSPSTSFVAFLWMHSRTFTSLNQGAQNCRQCSRWDRTMLNTEGWSPLLTVWPCCVWCTLGCRGLPSWLPGHAAGSHWACCQPAPPGPSLQGCSPATPLWISTCA